MWNRLGLQVRIMTYVTAGLVLLFGGLVYFNMLAVREASGQVYRERIALAQGLAHDVGEDFEYLASDLRMAMENFKTSGDDFQLAADSLYQSIKAHAASQFFRVVSVSLRDEQGHLITRSPTSAGEATPLSPNEIQLAIAQNRPLVLYPQNAVGAADRFATVALPISDASEDGRSLIVVAETVGVRGILPVIPGGGVGYSMEIVEVNGGTVVSASEPEQVGQKSPHYDILIPYVKARSGGVEIHRMSEGAPGGDHVTAMTPLPNGPFYLTLEQPADIALAIPRRLRNEMLIAGIISIPLMLGVAWFTTRRVVRPVEQLRAATRAIASGNLDDPIRVIAQDEIGDLANDAETMRRQLKKLLNDIERAKSELEQRVAERTQRLSELLGKVIGAQEGERQRLAREIHDEQSQALGALLVMLDRIAWLSGPASSEVKGEIEQARDMVRHLLAETRRLIYDLRPSVLDDMGLEAAIRWCVETHLERKGMGVTIQSSLPSRRLPGTVEVALFRVAQEAIVNIERHSQARHAGILLEQRDSTLHMRVWDDGEGFVPNRKESGPQTSGLGLQGMEERVRLIGGNMEISSTPGRGTIIEVKVPLNQGGGA